MQLFERETPLRALNDTLEAVREGEGRVLLVSGEAGIGKTSLVEHFVTHLAQPVPVYWGACDALFTPRPLGPFNDIAFQMRSDLLDQILSGQDWFHVATAFLAELSQRAAPVIIVLEDLHWADEATLDMLKYLGRRIQHSPVLMILTFRDDELNNRHLLWNLSGDLLPRITTRIALSPLSENTVAYMAEHAQRYREGIFTLTGGNPFFVTEVLESQAEAVPASVRDLVLARLARLSPAARELAELVSLMPGGADLRLLEQGFQSSLAALDECVQHGVLRVSGETLAFRHELARQAVEQALLPGRLRQLHGQVLNELLRGAFVNTPLAQIVHHAVRAGDGAAIARFAPQAARQASRLGSHREAAAHYQAVLDKVASIPEETRAEWLEGLSYELYLTGELEQAFQARQQAVSIWRALSQHRQEGDNLRWLSRLAWFLGRKSAAEQYAQAAVETLEKLPPGLELAWAYSNQSQLYMLSENLEAARGWGERAMALARQLENSEVLVHASINVGTAAVQAGDTAGWETLTTALALARQQELHDHVARAYANLISEAVQFRRYAQALNWLEEGLAYMGERDLDSYRIYLLGWRARLYFETGRWEEAEREALAALHLHQGESVIPIPALIVFGHLKVRRGDLDAADWLEKASRLALPTGELQRIGPLATARAEAAGWQVGNPQTDPVVKVGFELALQGYNPWTLGNVTYWLWRAGEDDLPYERLAEPYRWMVQGEWRQAAEAWAKLGCPFEQALALSLGDERAQMEALAIFEDLGARPAAKALKDQMRDQGVKGIPRGPIQRTRQNPAGLTQREVQVLVLLAEGLSNAGIAAHLSISKKTADHHVSAVLGKLDAASRSEALAIARRMGLLS